MLPENVTNANSPYGIQTESRYSIFERPFKDFVSDEETTYVGIRSTDFSPKNLTEAPKRTTYIVPHVRQSAL